MAGSMRRDVARLVKSLVKDHGCEANLSKSGHWRVTRPGYQIVTVAGTPNSQLVMKTIKADVRRHLGIDLSV